jgi:fibronectin type 3 domain-containing protein
MDWMIRASVDYIEFWAPKNLAVSNLGDDINLAWDIVPAATTYNIYKGTTPTTITTPLATGVAGHGYTDVNAATDSKAFYKVSATAAARSTNNRRSIPVSNTQNKTFIGNTANTPAVMRAEN